MGNVTLVFSGDAGDPADSHAVRGEAFREWDLYRPGQDGL